MSYTSAAYAGPWVAKTPQGLDTVSMISPEQPGMSAIRASDVARYALNSPGVHQAREVQELKTHNSAQESSNE